MVPLIIWYISIKDISHRYGVSVRGLNQWVMIIMLYIAISIYVILHWDCLVDDVVILIEKLLKFIIDDSLLERFNSFIFVEK